MLGILEVFANGMLMCFSLWRTGSIWFAVGNHAAWDWAQTFFFGTPDSGMKPIGALFAPSFHGPALLSGGAGGPEASVLIFLSETLTAALILILYRKRKETRSPGRNYSEGRCALLPMTIGDALQRLCHSDSYRFATPVQKA